MRKLLKAFSISISIHLLAFLLIFAIIAAIAVPRSKAANLPFFSGPASNEPSQENATLNQLIQNIYSGVSGIIASQPGPVAGGNTLVGTFATTPIPTSTLALPGQALRMKCSGYLSGSSNSRAVSLNFGSVAVTSGSLTTAHGAWEIDLLVQAITATANYAAVGHIFFQGSVVTTYDQVVTSDNLSTAITASCTNQEQTTEVNGITMTNFLIEQVK